MNAPDTGQLDSSAMSRPDHDCPDRRARFGRRTAHDRHRVPARVAAMKALSLQITYRKREPFAAYIYLARTLGQKSARTEEIGPELLVGYATDGTPIGIEIVSPGYVSVEEIYEAFDKLGLGRPSPGELAPLCPV